ncbi:MAG: hypothetical protein E7B29_18750, partial [Mixta calida]|nr:hypothetical protein [Mixta calida]
IQQFLIIFLENISPTSSFMSLALVSATLCPARSALLFGPLSAAFIRALKGCGISGRFGFSIARSSSG